MTRVGRGRHDGGVGASVRDDLALPLAGVTVVGLEQAVAAPFATRQLGDLGARVIKIERPGAGDFARGYDETVHGESSYFVWLNRAKESITVDVKAPEGREIVRRLLAGADVLVQNLGPGASARLGLDAATLAAELPRLVVCDVTGYGARGAWADRKSYDLVVQCETGLAGITGGADAPARAGISVADIAAGMYAFSGVLAALYRRAITGVAGPVEVSLFDAMSEWMGAPLYFARYGGAEPARAGAHHATIAPYGPFGTADGDDVVVAVQNDREWRAFCAGVLDRPELADDPRFARNSDRVAHRDELAGYVAAQLVALGTADVLARLDRARIASGGLRPVGALPDHPAFEGRDRWATIGVDGHDVPALRPPIQLAGPAPPRLGDVPAVGEHTDRVLAELGYSPAEIERLRAGGVV